MNDEETESGREEGRISRWRAGTGRKRSKMEIKCVLNYSKSISEPLSVWFKKCISVNRKTKSVPIKETQNGDCKDTAITKKMKNYWKVKNKIWIQNNYTDTKPLRREANESQKKCKTLNISKRTRHDDRRSGHKDAKWQKTRHKTKYAKWLTLSFHIVKIKSPLHIHSSNIDDLRTKYFKTQLSLLKAFLGLWLKWMCCDVRLSLPLLWIHGESRNMKSQRCGEEETDK